MRTRRSVLATTAGLAAGLAGCAPADSPRETTTATDEPRPAAPVEVPDGPYWYTHPNPTGNRLLAGGADLQGKDPVRITLEGGPLFLVAHSGSPGTVWTLVTRDGTVRRWQVSEGRARPLADGASLPAGSPPVVAGTGQGALPVRPPPDASNRGGITLVPGGDGADPRLATIAGNGDLLVTGPGGGRRFPIRAPADSRPAALGDGRVVVYGDRTDRYGHGALGDGIEPAALYMVDPAGPSLRRLTSLDAPAVFEGVQPLVADLDADGDPEVVTTVADSADGAWIAVFAPTGERLGTGPVYGPGWRHQLLAGPLGPAGDTELAAVLKPHVTKRLEFYRLNAGGLAVSASLDGFSTHSYGSRVIGGAVAADLDGDGRTEVLLPRGDRRRLAAVRRNDGGAEIAWHWPLEARVASNLTGVRTATGDVAVGVATTDALLVWSG